MPPLILTWKSCTTYLRQDELPRGGPGWGDELAKWRDFILCLCHCGKASRFLRIQNKADPEFREPPSNWRLRGFILEGYFAPFFQYDSNCNGWHHNFTWLFAVPGQYCMIIEQEGWVIVPGRSSPWTEATDWAPSPLAIAGYLARSGLSFQEADDLYEWAAAALHEDVIGCNADPNIIADLVVTDTASEGPEWSLKYYEERAEQAEELLEFQDMEPLPSDTLSLLRVNEAAGYLPAPKQKKKHHSCCKTTDTDEEAYSSWAEEPWEDDEDPGLPWNPRGDQMDVNSDGPSQM